MRSIRESLREPDGWVLTLARRLTARAGPLPSLAKHLGPNDAISSPLSGVPVPNAELQSARGVVRDWYRGRTSLARHVRR